MIKPRQTSSTTKSSSKTRSKSKSEKSKSKKSEKSTVNSEPSPAISPPMPSDVPAPLPTVIVPPRASTLVVSPYPIPTTHAPGEPELKRATSQKKPAITKDIQVKLPSSKLDVLASTIEVFPLEVVEPLSDTPHVESTVVEKELDGEGVQQKDQRSEEKKSEKEGELGEGKKGEIEEQQGEQVGDSEEEKGSEGEDDSESVGNEEEKKVKVGVLNLRVR
ncbi:PREDICTED: proline-, glutamic acid- and leucine-rich protein 1-like [Nicotiana attenuata]|uniref:proline-, glutamic acid- and leucine-rich protein 1-like n=1 Tax=Nicotiana attenuata TaxID=49451 RepID=UPI00090508F1|nr:PREDICTED: proline-, glutamic acid- and leucine-rich protein 1-like [Nicotiana attenuata]